MKNVPTCVFNLCRVRLEQSNLIVMPSNLDSEPINERVGNVMVCTIWGFTAILTTTKSIAAHTLKLELRTAWVTYIMRIKKV